MKRFIYNIRSMQRALLFALLQLFALTAFAYDFESEGIYYNWISENTVEVTYGPDDAEKYSGDIEIPATITFDGIEAQVVRVGVWAFKDCTGLTSVVLPEGITTIFAQAFKNCRYLTSVNIPSGVTNIGNGAFESCASLTSLVLPESLSTIGEGVFRSCQTLQTINIPSGWTTIEKWTFAECWKLASIELPDGITSIGENAFYECSNITSLTIPDGVTTIGKLAFSGCEQLESINIPSGVTTIEQGTFGSCKKLTSIVIPEGVTSIGNSAFNGCTNLVSVVIPEGVVSLGGLAFYECTSLTSVTIPSTLTTLGGMAFSYCSNLADVTNMADVPQEIAGNVFSNYDATLHVKHGLHTTYKAAPVWQNFATIIDDADGNPTPTELPDNFYYDGLYYTKLSENTVALSMLPGNIITYSGDIVVPAKVTYEGLEARVVAIGGSAFSGAAGLTSISLPEGLESIGPNAFYGCNLTEIVVPETVTEIGSLAFALCRNLKTINIPSGVKEISDQMFVDCNSLETLTLPNGITRIGGSAFNSCENLTSLDIPETVSYIGDTAFHECTGLTSLVIPEGVRFIFGETFSGCTNLASVTIPSTVHEIYYTAFSGCVNLADVFNLSVTPQSITENTFATYGNLHVRQGLANTYATAPVWEKFNIIDDQEGAGGELLRNGDAETSWEDLGLENESYDGLYNYDVCAWSKENNGDPHIAEIVELPEGGHAFIVRATDVEEQEDGSEAWANQFWIQSPRQWEKDTQIRIHFRYKASQNAITQTQIHGKKPGDYLYWEAIGDVEFTTEWQTYDDIITLNEDMDGAWSVAFNLNSNVKTAADFYFDDLSWKVYDPAEGTFFTNGLYYNKLSENTVEVIAAPDNDLAYVGEMSIPEIVVYNDKEYTVVGIAEGAFANSTQLISISIPASVSRIDYNAFWNCDKLADVTNLAATPQEIEDKVFSTYGTLHVALGLRDVYAAAPVWNMFNVIDGSEGVWFEQLYNGDAEKSWQELGLADVASDDMENNYKVSAWGKENAGDPHPATIEEEDGGNHVFVVHGGDCVTEGEESNWDNQFWIESPQAWTSGTVMRVRFRYKASQNVTAQTQIHRQEPSDYIHWEAIGDVKFSTEWQQFDQIFTFTPDMDGGCSIAFNLNSEVKTATDFYFDDLSWQVQAPDGGYIKVGGIYYNVTTMTTVEVAPVAEGADPYMGTVVIPSRIRYSENKYDVVGIADGAFRNSETLYEVTIPNTVKHIGAEAFMGCNELGYIYNYSRVPQDIAEGTFSWYGILNVPYGTKDAYNAAPVWNQFNVIDDSERTWYELLFNGDAEKSWEELGLADVTYDDMENNYKLCAWGKENGTNTGEDGESLPHPAEIVALPEGGHAFIVRATDVELKVDGEEAWDNQFWIQSPYQWSEGTQLKLHFRYKASQNVGVVTQMHRQMPSDYLYWEAIGDVEFSTEWQDFDKILTITPDMDGAWAIAFNLNSEVKTATDFYFDDLSWSVLGPENGVFSSDGLYYNILSDNTVEVAPVPEGVEKYSGDIVIPETTHYYNHEFNVVGIGFNAFSSCIDLTSVSVPESVVSIEEGAFYNCSSLTSLVLPDGVTFIGERAFLGCTNLASINIPSGVTSIEEFTFADCNSLTSLVLPDGVTTIGAGAFINCYALASINIPSGVTRIERYTFSECYSLTSLVIPDGVTYIGDYAFYLCRSLASINIPSGVTSIEEYTFTECAITSVVLPDGITSIGDLAFYYCRDLESVNIPSSMASIGERAFCGCSSLSSIILPEGVTSISSEAFMDCNALADVTNLADTPQQITEDVFSNYNATLHVKRGLKQTYAQAPVWQNFYTIKTDAEGAPDPEPFVEVDLDEPGTLEDEIWYPEIVEGLTITGPINGTDVNYIRTQLPELRFLNIEGAWVVEGGSAYYSTLSADSTDVEAPLYTSNYTIGDYMFSEMPRLHELMLCSNTKNIGKYIIAGSDNLFRIEIPQQVTNVADGALGGIKRVMVQWNADNAVVTDGVSDNPNLIIYATQNYKGNAARENLVIGDMAENIVLHEGNNLYIPQPFWAKQASYTRTFSKQTLRATSAGWESIVLPFDVTNVVSEQKGRIVPFGSDEATDKHFYLARLGDNGFEMASELSANVPYIVSMPNSPEYAEQYNITGRVMFYAKSASGIYVSTTDEASESAGPAYTFVPAYEKIQATPNFYVLNEEVYNGYMPGSVFLPNVEVEPFHPFVVDTSAHAPAYIPVFEGDVTAIMPILDMKPSRTDDAVYDLMGIRQDPNHLQKGKVYIVNGSKRVVKE